jgi:small subunit ribosomal protein S16
MLAIRLQRVGAKKNPLYRVAVTERASARDSRVHEILGTYNPQTKPEAMTLDLARYAHWVGAGARPSDSVRTLVQRNKTALQAAADAKAAVGQAAPAATEASAS